MLVLATMLIIILTVAAYVTAYALNSIRHALGDLWILEHESKHKEEREAEQTAFGHPITEDFIYNKYH